MLVKGAGVKKKEVIDNPDFQFVCPMHEQYCICRKGPNAYGGFMIQCDTCDEWFHGKCVGISKAVSAVPGFDWKCSDCKLKAQLKATETSTTRLRSIGNFDKLPDDLILRVLCSFCNADEVGLCLLRMMRTCKLALTIVNTYMVSLQHRYSKLFGPAYDVNEEIYVARYIEQRERASNSSVLALSGWRVPHRLTQTMEGWYICLRADTLAQISAKHKVSIAALERQNSNEFVDRHRRSRLIKVTRRMVFKEGTAVWIPSLELDATVKADEARKERERQAIAEQLKHARDEQARLESQRQVMSIEMPQLSLGDRVTHRKGFTAGTVRSCSVDSGLQVCEVEWDTSILQVVPCSLLRKAVLSPKRKRRNSQKLA